MNNPTTAITDAMLQAARQASDWVADLRDEEISHIYLAMQSATPSTPELEELVERCAKAMHKSRCERMGLAHHHDPVAPPCNGDLAEARAALKAAGISELQKEIDTKTAALQRARKVISEEFCGNGGDHLGYELKLVDAALSTKGGVL
jgi:hypothetical protein